LASGGFAEFVGKKFNTFCRNFRLTVRDAEYGDTGRPIQVFFAFAVIFACRKPLYSRKLQTFPNVAKEVVNA